MAKTAPREFYPSEIDTKPISTRVAASLKERVERVQKRKNDRSWARKVVEDALERAVTREEASA